MGTIAPSGEGAIRHPALDYAPSPAAEKLAPAEVFEAYDIVATTDWIGARKFRVVGLQFPDQLLPHSVAIFRALRERLPCPPNGQLGKGEQGTVELYIMADTTYGSCCVDEVAAQHANIDAIVHYGHACMTLTSRLPVFYVFPKAAINEDVIPSLAQSFAAALADWHSEVGFGVARDFNMHQYIRLLYDVAFDNIVDRLSSELEKLLDAPIRLNHLSKTRDPLSAETSDGSSPQTFPQLHDESSCCASTGAAFAAANGSPAATPLDAASQPMGRNNSEASAVFYIGPESRHLTHILLANSNAPVFALDPLAPSPRAELQSTNSNRLLMRRYGVVQRARDADTVGIVVGTLGAAGYLPILSYLRSLLKRHRRKSYTVAVGKLRPEKLANFSEVECWVLVACPENALLEGIGAKDYLVPVVTPWELEVALASSVDDREPPEGRKWGHKYVLDFYEIIGQTAEGGGSQKEYSGSEEDGPIFSTATGKYKHRKRWVTRKTPDFNTLILEASALSMQNRDSAVATVMGSPAGEHLIGRSYRGLEPRSGMDVPAIVEEGRTGIARGYSDCGGTS